MRLPRGSPATCTASTACANRSGMRSAGCPTGRQVQEKLRPAWTGGGRPAEGHFTSAPPRTGSRERWRTSDGGTGPAPPNSAASTPHCDFQTFSASPPAALSTPVATGPKTDSLTRDARLIALLSPQLRSSSGNPHHSSLPDHSDRLRLVVALRPTSDRQRNPRTETERPS